MTNSATFASAKASNKSVVSFAVRSKRTTVDRTNTHFAGKRVSAHNEVAVNCIETLVKIGDVVTVEVAANRSSAKDYYFAIINSLESKFIVKSDFICGSYCAVIVSAKLKALK